MGLEPNIDDNSNQNPISKEILEQKRNEIIKDFKNFLNVRFNIVIIDFVVKNSELEFYSNVIIKIESTNTGYSFDISVDTQSIKSLSYIQKNLAYIIIDWSFLLITIIFIYHFLYYDFVYAKNIAIIYSHDKFSSVIKNIGKLTIEKSIGKNLNNNNKDEFSSFENKQELKNNLNPNKKNLFKSITLDNSEKEKNNIFKKLTQNWKYIDFLRALGEIYIDNFQDTLRKISMISSLIMMIFYIYDFIFIFIYNDDLEKTSIKYNVVSNFNFSNSLIKNAGGLDQSSKVRGITAIFIFFRLFKTFESFVPLIGVYLKGLRRSILDILAFIMLFMFIILGLSIILFFYYSRQIKEFQTLPNCMIYNICFFIGNPNVDLFNKMFTITPFSTTIYLLFIILLVRFAFLRILLAIILYNFEDLKYSKGKRYKSLTVAEFKKTVNRDFLYGFFIYLKELPQNIKNFFSSKSSFEIKNKKGINFDESEKNFQISYETKKKLQSDSKIISNDVNIEIVGGNLFEKDIENKVDKKPIIYNNIIKKPTDLSNSKISNSLSYKILSLEDLRFIYGKFIENFEIVSRNPYFDSPEDLERVSVYYQTTYEINFKKNILYIIYVIFMIFSVLYNSTPFWRYSFKKLFDNGIFIQGYDKTYIEIGI